MTLKTVQAVIKRGVTDSEFKDRLLSNPEEVLSRFDLRGEEKEAMIRVQARLALATNNSDQLEEAIGPYGSWF